MFRLHPCAASACAITLFTAALVPSQSFAAIYIESVHGDLPSEPQVRGLEYESHAAAAEHALEPIPVVDHLAEELGAIELFALQRRRGVVELHRIGAVPRHWAWPLCHHRL